MSASPSLKARFVDRSVPSIRCVYERFSFAREAKEALIAHLQHCIDVGALPATVTAPVAFRLLITALLGAATMRLTDRLSPGENADDIAGDAIDVTLAGLKSGISLRSHLSPVPSTGGTAAVTKESSQ